MLRTADPDDWGPADAAIGCLADYDWIVLTSTNGVSAFLRRFKEQGGSREALLGSKLAAVGSATAEKMRRHGIPAQLVPADFRAEGLVDAFREMGAGSGWRVLLPRACEAREVLPDSLRKLGVSVDDVAVYNTQRVAPEPAVLLRLAAGTVDCVTVTSGAIGKALVATLLEAGVDPERVLAGVVVASIGPVTTHALEALGYRVDLEAPQATVDSLARAIGCFTAWKR
jgi:uroporphyrinogen III methyltransferase/synthase